MITFITTSTINNKCGYDLGVVRGVDSCPENCSRKVGISKALQHSKPCFISRGVVTNKYYN